MMFAQASQTHDLLWATLISSGLLFVGVLITAVLAWSNHRTGRSISEQVRPENGARLGPLVEQIAQTVEATNGRVHETSKRVDRVETKLDSHIEETTPLVEKFKEMLKEKEGT
jgi:hypothetical protein